MNFADERLVNLHGNWVKVQVAFYDFIMRVGLNKLEVTEDDINDFRRGVGMYDAMIARCWDDFETPEVAWELFLKHEGL